MLCKDQRREKGKGQRRAKEKGKGKRKAKDREGRNRRAKDREKQRTEKNKGHTRVENHDPMIA